MEESIREIRILSGLQAGASLALSAGMYLLGTADDCDIVFNDRQMQAQHARLYIDEASVRIENQGGMVFTQQEEAYEGEVALGTLLRAGNTWFVVDNSDAPWPDMEAIFSAMKPPKLLEGRDSEIETDAEGMALDLDNPELTTDQEISAEMVDNLPQDNNEAPALHSEPMNLFSMDFFRKHLVRTIAALFVLGIAISCIYLAFKPSTKQKPISEQTVIQNNIRQIEQLLQSLRLKQRINVTQNKQGKLVVSGYVANAQDMSALVGGLAKLNLKLELRLFDESKILNEVNHILLNTKFPIKAINLGMGRIQLVGAAASYENIDGLLQKMNFTVDGLRSIDSEILVGDQLVAKLRQMIVDHGLSGKIALTVNNGEAIVNGALDVREMAQWEQLMAQFVATYGNILPIRASFPPTANMLPFKVLSAFSGDMPFIVTDQGQKVMLGGHIKGYTLVNITEQEIVFDGPRKVQIQR